MSKNKIKHQRTSKFLPPCQKMDIPPFILGSPKSWIFLHTTSHHGTRYSINYNVRWIHPRPHQQQLWIRERYYSCRHIAPLSNIQLPQLEDQPFPQKTPAVLARDITLCLYKRHCNFLTCPSLTTKNHPYHQ